MSNALQTSALLEAIRAAVVTAWGSIPISYGAPPEAITAPYAVIFADSVEIEFGGAVGTMGNTSQSNSFTIWGRWPFPSDPTQVIELQKISYANALIAQLQSAANFAGIGMFPIVSGIDFTEPDDPNERVFEVTATFHVITQASHH
jgi:hypothetical protein